MFKPYKVAVSSAPGIGKFKIEHFLGVDSTNAPINVHNNRSPYCPNMVRETRGKVRKRTGFHTEKTFSGKINGVHFFTDHTGTKKLVHAGTNIYLCGETDAVLYSEAADERSVARQMGGKLCILDGKALLLFGKKGEEYLIETAQSVGYTPTILISRNPTGGGTAYEPVNLISPRRTEQFLGTATDKVYQLSGKDLDAAAITVKKKNAQGGFDEWVEGTNFTADRTLGKITFTVAPGVPPVTGEDNVYITYEKTVAEYSDKINRCTICTLYGVSGSRDRLFVSGNGKWQNQDYYSQMDNPTYFGDLWYAVIGQDDSPIMGYSIVNDQLATHKNGGDNDANIVLRKGMLSGSQAAFVLSGSLQGAGAVSRYAYGILETEPLFAVKGDIMAVTPSDISGERYMQSRGYYLRGLLQKEDLSQAVAFVFDQFYLLAVGDKVFLLDGTQASAESKAPYSTRQYEGYYWVGVGARVLFSEDGVLKFGTENGELCAFYRDYEKGASFQDNGKAIYAAWQTSEFGGQDFYNRKDFQKISVLLGAAVATGCRIWGIYDGGKELLRDYDSTARYFSYTQFSYQKTSYKTDRTPQELIDKIKIRKVKKVQFLFENDCLNEPFGLYSAAAEFTESR